MLNSDRIRESRSYLRFTKDGVERIGEMVDYITPKDRMLIKTAEGLFKCEECEILEYMGSAGSPLLIGDRILFRDSKNLRDGVRVGTITKAYNGYCAPRYDVEEEYTQTQFFIWGKWIVKQLPLKK